MHNYRTGGVWYPVKLYQLRSQDVQEGYGSALCWPHLWTSLQSRGFKNEYHEIIGIISFFFNYSGSMLLHKAKKYNQWQIFKRVIRKLNSKWFALILISSLFTFLFWTMTLPTIKWGLETERSFCFPLFMLLVNSVVEGSLNSLVIVPWDEILWPSPELTWTINLN